MIIVVDKETCIAYSLLMAVYGTVYPTMTLSDPRTASISKEDTKGGHDRFPKETV